MNTQSSVNIVKALKEKRERKAAEIAQKQRDYHRQYRSKIHAEWLPTLRELETVAKAFPEQLVVYGLDDIYTIPGFGVGGRVFNLDRRAFDVRLVELHVSPRRAIVSGSASSPEELLPELLELIASQLK